MLKRFRRSSKAKIQLQKADEELALGRNETDQSMPQQGFFSLPAELRNEIYRLVACNTDLCLLEPRKGRSVISRKGSVSALPIPGLLLVSRQLRHESLFILLSNARINLKVTDFDFFRLCKALAALSSTEKEAIESNPNLSITMRMKKCNGDVAAGLRVWCLVRDWSTSIDWGYRLDEGNMRDIREGQAGAVRWYAVRAGVLFEQEKSEFVRREVMRVLKTLHRALEEDTNAGPRNDSVLMRSSWRPMYI